MFGPSGLVAQTQSGLRVSVPNAFLPTASNAPWLIRYSVSDAAENQAEVVVRELSIICAEVRRAVNCPEQGA